MSFAEKGLSSWVLMSCLDNFRVEQQISLSFLCNNLSKLRTRKQKDEKGGKAGEKKGMGEGQESLLHGDHKKTKQKRMGEGQKGRSNFSIATIKMVAGGWGEVEAITH